MRDEHSPAISLTRTRIGRGDWSQTAAAHRADFFPLLLDFLCQRTLGARTLVFRRQQSGASSARLSGIAKAAVQAQRLGQQLQTPRIGFLGRFHRAFGKFETFVEIGGWRLFAAQEKVGERVDRVVEIVANVRIAAMLDQQLLGEFEACAELRDRFRILMGSAEILRDIVADEAQMTFPFEFGFGCAQMSSRISSALR